MKRTTKIYFIFTLFLTNLIYSQNTKQVSTNSDLLKKEWAAKWITAPDAKPNGYGVYLFRKTIELTAPVANFIVHVSADNRYKLYVNEQLVSVGPARGDMFHWNYETVDLAPHLAEGKNIIAAKVWNEGEYKPEAQISWRTGFILQGNSPAEQAVASPYSDRDDLRLAG